MTEARGTLEPAMVALIDQASQGAKEYVVEVRKELKAFLDNHPDVTKAEITYMLVDQFNRLLSKEQAIMSFSTVLLGDFEDK